MAVTDEQWLVYPEPYLMVQYLKGNWFRRILERFRLATFLISDRKVRLFSCACCRRCERLLHDERSKDALITNEQYADRLMDQAEVEWAQKAALAATNAATVRVYFEHNESEWPRLQAARLVSRAMSELSLNESLSLALEAADLLDGIGIQVVDPFSGRLVAREPERLKQANLLRDIFGNPFRPVTLARAWQTANTVALAHAIYTDRAFERLPILADALEDAGCDNADILNHCRQPGEHVRGCWVVDLVLDKK